MKMMNKHKKISLRERDLILKYRNVTGNLKKGLVKGNIEGKKLTMYFINYLRGK